MATEQDVPLCVIVSKHFLSVALQISTTAPAGRVPTEEGVLTVSTPTRVVVLLTTLGQTAKPVHRQFLYANVSAMPFKKSYDNCMSMRNISRSFYLA